MLSKIVRRFQYEVRVTYILAGTVVLSVAEKIVADVKYIVGWSMFFLGVGRALERAAKR